MIPPAFWAVIAGVFGLAVGSFVNVVIYRVPAGESVVSPPSRCPSCGSPVRPRHNIPVLGWLLLANAVGGIVVEYLVGVPVLAWRAELSLAEAATSSLVFLPGDGVKVIVSAVVTAAVLRGYPGIVPGSRPATSAPGGSSEPEL